MTPNSISMDSVKLVVLASFFILIAAGSTSAGSEGAEKRVWQERYSSLISGVAHAEQRVEASRAAYSKAKQRNRLKGDLKLEILQEIQDAEAQLARLKKELAEFPDEAHRAGVPPGWLREVEDG